MHSKLPVNLQATRHGVPTSPRLYSQAVSQNLHWFPFRRCVTVIWDRAWSTRKWKLWLDRGKRRSDRSSSWSSSIPYLRSWCSTRSIARAWRTSSWLQWLRVAHTSMKANSASWTWISSSSYLCTGYWTQLCMFSSQLLQIDCSCNREGNNQTTRCRGLWLLLHNR